MTSPIIIDIRACTPASVGSQNFTYVGGLIQSLIPAPTKLFFPFLGEDGFWEVRVKYACAESRPVAVSIYDGSDTTILTDIGLNMVTGGWGSNNCSVVTVGNFKLTAKPHQIIVSRASHVPHLSAIQLHKCTLQT